MAQISIDDLDEVELMLTELEISKGKGNLVICVVASPAYRAKVIQLIQDRFSTKITQIEDGNTLIYDLKGEKTEGVEVSLWIFPESLPNDIIDALNNFREFFYQAGIPSIVFLSPSALHQVISLAPDFWRYRGGFHLLKGDETGKAYQAVEALSTSFNLSYQDKEELLRRKNINEYLLEKIKDRKDLCKTQIELGIIHSKLAETREAIQYFEQALAIAQEFGDRRIEGACLGNLGIVYSHLGEQRKAICCLEEALKISRNIADRTGEGNRLGNLGNVYLHLGEPRKAIENYEQALKISRDTENRRSEGNHLGNLGIAYSDVGELRKAIDYYEQALKISREIADRMVEGNFLGNLGLAYLDLGEPLKAIEYHNHALKISREIGDRRGEGSDLGNLGLAYSHLNELHKAIEYYERALEISKEIGDRMGEGNHLSNLSTALYRLGRNQEAINCVESAIKIFEQIESPKLIPAKKTLAKWKEAETPK